jgi:hypothetical protein
VAALYLCRHYVPGMRLMRYGTTSRGALRWRCARNGVPRSGGLLVSDTRRRRQRGSNRNISSRTTDMAIKIPKRTLGNEVRPGRRARMAGNSGRQAIVERAPEHVPIGDFLDTNLYSIAIYLGNRRSTTTTNARTRGSAQQKCPKKRIRPLNQNRLRRAGERSKNQYARSKNTRVFDQNPWREVGYVKSDERSKNAKIARSPANGFRRKFLMQNNIRNVEAAQGNTVKIPEVRKCLSRLKGDTKKAWLRSRCSWVARRSLLVVRFAGQGRLRMAEYTRIPLSGARRRCDLLLNRGRALTVHGTNRAGISAKLAGPIHARPHSLLFEVCRQDGGFRKFW